MTRRLLLSGVVALGLAGPSAAAAQEREKPMEIYAKLPTVTLEFWDQNGLFHMVAFDALVVFHEQNRVDKSVANAITLALSAMTWEEFSRGNPAATIKAVALDVVRKEPGADQAIEVLLMRLIIR